MLEALTEKFNALLGKLRFKTVLTERNVREACEEVRLALLDADVNYSVAGDFVGRVRKKALGEEVTKGVQPGQMFVKVVYDELVGLLGPTDAQLHFRPGGVTVILLAGLQGSGKTTTAAKLGVFVKKKGRQPLLAAADVQRPAAIEQLKVLGDSVGIPFFAQEKGTPVEICTFAVKMAGSLGKDVVILDTAGRLHIDEELMTELEQIASAALPSEILLVVDAMTGQDAANSAKVFNERLEISGVILTKLDSDARGGAALSIRAVTGKPIRFIGTGEKTDALEEFHPDRLASRILGMGDMVSLVEKAQEKMDQEEALRLQKKLLDRSFTLEDMLAQFRQVKKLGNLKDMITMLPGFSQIAGAAEVDDREFSRYEAIICSMTPEERISPEILSESRRRRVARGSGTVPAEVSAIVKQFREIRKLFSGKGKLAGMFSGLLGGFGFGQPKVAKSAPGSTPSREKRAALRQRRKKERRKRRR